MDREMISGFWHCNYQSNLTFLEKPEFSKSLVNDLFLMYFSVWSHGPMQGPPGPANKLGAWCRSSPGGGTHFQNPNFEISSFFALWSVPAALRNSHKKGDPRFYKHFSPIGVPAALRNPQKKRDPRFYKHFSLVERACGASESSKQGDPRFYKHCSLVERACGASESSKKAMTKISCMYPYFLNIHFPFVATYPPYLGWPVKASLLGV